MKVVVKAIIVETVIEELNPFDGGPDLEYGS